MITSEEKIRLEKTVARAFSREDWEWLCVEKHYAEVVDNVTSGEAVFMAIVVGFALMESRNVGAVTAINA